MNFCRICNLSCGNVFNFESHLNGARHARAVNAQRVGAGHFTCALCGRSCGNQANLDTHLRVSVGCRVTVREEPDEPYELEQEAEVEVWGAVREESVEEPEEQEAGVEVWGAVPVGLGGGEPTVINISDDTINITDIEDSVNSDVGEQYTLLLDITDAHLSQVEDSVLDLSAIVPVHGARWVGRLGHELFASSSVQAQNLTTAVFSAFEPLAASSPQE